jgi:hypothetical protein
LYFVNINIIVDGSNPKLTLSSQNVHSLNISTKNDITSSKILAITKRKCDIIFVCDVRLNSEKQKSAVHDIQKQFFLRGYKFFHNSRTSSRGVGILIHKNILEGQFTITLKGWMRMGIFYYWMLQWETQGTL